MKSTKKTLKRRFLYNFLRLDAKKLFSYIYCKILNRTCNKLRKIIFFLQSNNSKIESLIFFQRIYSRFVCIRTTPFLTEILVAGFRSPTKLSVFRTTSEVQRRMISSFQTSLTYAKASNATEIPRKTYMTCFLRIPIQR